MSLNRVGLPTRRGADRGLEPNRSVNERAVRLSVLQKLQIMNDPAIPELPPSQ